MNAQPSIIDTISLRFSCRTYSGELIPESARESLAEAAAGMHSGPFGSRVRFSLASATDGDASALKHLGTYGTIRGATAFILGAAEPGSGSVGDKSAGYVGDKSAGYVGDVGAMYLEDFGYAMEVLILHATALGLGTCWLGGFFNRGRFSRRIGATRTERIPSVAAVGRILDQEGARSGLMRRSVGGSRRKPWAELFHDGGFDTVLARETAGAYATPLEMARLAPSASNRQPVRIVREGASWHFFIRRTPGYPPRIARSLMRLEDLQRVDSGISMCHFELTARELGLPGRWVVSPPRMPMPDPMTEYAATWAG